MCVCVCLCEGVRKRVREKKRYICIERERDGKIEIDDAKRWKELALKWDGSEEKNCCNSKNKVNMASSII